MNIFSYLEKSNDSKQQLNAQDDITKNMNKPNQDDSGVQCTEIEEEQYVQQPENEIKSKKENDIYQFNMIKRFKEQQETQVHEVTDPDSDSDQNEEHNEDDHHKMDSESKKEHIQFMEEFENTIASNEQISKDIERFKPKEEANLSASTMESKAKDKGMPSIDFKALLSQQKRSTSFPFTNSHVEDMVFLKPTESSQEIVALECIFYMSDCSYYNLVEKPFDMNSMGTENYELADFDGRIEQMTFDKKPLNLKVDRTKSYTKQINSQLMKTQNNEARVEYFITKWKVTRNGGISKIAETPRFKIDGHFISHKNGLMELELSDDGSVIYIQQNVPNQHLKLFIWDVKNLKVIEIPNLQKVLDSLDKSKVKSLDLVQNNKYLLVLHNSKDNLRKFELIKISSGRVTFQLDTSFAKNGKPIISKTMDFGSKIFPFRVFIDNTEEQTNYYDKIGGVVMQAPVKFKILFILDQKYKFNDKSNKQIDGYPMTLVNVKLEELIQAKDPTEHILEKAANLFEIFKNEKCGLENVESIAGKFFMLPAQLIRWEDSENKLNPLRTIKMQANMDFSYLGIIAKYPVREFFVFSKNISEKNRNLGFMSNLKLDTQVLGELQFIRNQNVKKGIYCLYKDNSNDTIIYSFFQEDEHQPKKKLVLKNDHYDAKSDCMRIFSSGKAKLNEITIGAITLQQDSQRIIFNTYQPARNLVDLEQLSTRIPDNQDVQAQYPCLATNLGQEKLCLHINMNPNQPKALIYDFNKSKKEQEIFLSFINFSKFEDIGLDETNIKIDTCSRFVYLTRSKDSTQDGFRVWMNLLLIDPFTKNPHIVHFRSTKVFFFSLDEKYQDIIKGSLVFRMDDELQIMTQFPLGIQHALLRTDYTKNPPIDLIKSSYNYIDKARKTLENNPLLFSKTADTFNIQKKLNCTIAPLNMFQDNGKQDHSIYFVSHDKIQQIYEVKQFDPDKHDIMVILKIKVEKILLFLQLKDLRFVIIDGDGVINMYEKEDGKMDRCGMLYTNNEDQKFIKSQIQDFETVIMDNEVLVLKNKVMYISESKNEIATGILKCEDLKTQIKSDYKIQMINGPIKIAGQNQFIEIFIFKDSGQINYFEYTQRIYTMPNSKKQKLINDFNQSCQFSSFQQDGLILAQFGSKFLKFSASGVPLDQIEFESLSTMYLGEQEYQLQDRIFFVVYWQQFQFQSDSGLNKTIFIGENEENQAKQFFSKIRQAPAILVKVDRNKGLEYLAHKKRGTFWHGQLLKKAKNDYFQRFELETISEDNKYLLFFDNFLGDFSLWDVEDTTVKAVENTLRTKVNKRQSVRDIKNTLQINSSISPEAQKMLDQIGENLRNSLTNRYPEVVNPPYKLPITKQKQYIDRFLEPINFDFVRATISPSEPSNSWSLHQPIQLLNSDKTKFNCCVVNSEFSLSIVFDTPQEISAYGFKSANNFPHMDPKKIRVKVRVEGQEQFYETTKIDNIDFERRYQTKNYIKLNPWEKIEEIKFTFYRKEQKEKIEMQLSQIIIYKKREKFDFTFRKIMDINLWEEKIQTNAMGIPAQVILEAKSNIFSTLESNEGLSKLNFNSNKIKQIAFLRQRNVFKNINFMDNTLKIIFAFCDQDLQREGKMKFIGTVFTKNLKTKLEQTENFCHSIEIDKEQQKNEAQEIMKKVLKAKRQSEQFFIEQESLAEHLKNVEALSDIKIKRRNLVFQFSQIVSAKFGRKYAIIKESSKVVYMRIDQLIKNNEEKGPAKKLLQQLSFKLPTKQSEILDLYFTKDDDVIQILAIDNSQKVLIVATWNVEKDSEVSMFQLKSGHPYPRMLFLEGIDHQKKIKQGSKIICTHQGQSNYFLQGDMVIDLENNIPFFHSQVSQEISPKYLNSVLNQVPNLKKMFRDSSRFLGVYKPHSLIFTYSRKDTYYWRQVLASNNTKALISKQHRLLEAFRVRYNGISLFHNFAGNTEIMSLINTKYISAKDQGKFHDDSIRLMPLFILNPDDNHHLSALDIAIKQQKPNNFEMMVAMLKDFHEICSSKMMLNNFQDMIISGFGQVLEYFDKSQFNPPLLQTPFVIQWPDDLDQIVFASETSLISSDILKKQVEEHVLKNQTYIDKILKHDFVGVQEVESIREKYQLNLERDDMKDPFRKITVQALDFDWIFNGDNTMRFIRLLDLEGADQLYEQYSIKIFVQLMWQHVRPYILKYEFFPYVVYLFCFILLTSSFQYNFINMMKVVDHEGNIIQEQPENYQFLFLYQIVLQAILLLFVLKFLRRELIQIIDIGLTDYLTNGWNFFDAISLLINLAYILLAAISFKDYESGIWVEAQRRIRTISAFAVFLMWIKLFYWMKLYPQPAYFLTQLQETQKSVLGFLVMFVIVGFAFSNFFLILQLNLDNNDEDAPNIVESSVGNSYIDAIISMYLLALGEFNTDGYTSGNNPFAAWFMFIFATLILLLLFMNMLIAVMAEPFGDVAAAADLYKYKQQIEMIHDHQDLVDLSKLFKKQKYIMIIKPEEAYVDETETLESKIDILQETLRTDVKSIQRQLKYLREKVDKKIQD